MSPESRLPERTMILTRWRPEMESGKPPEKLLSLRYIDLRLTKPERSGIGPESELLLKLSTRS